jgi:hypothetical protein
MERNMAVELKEMAAGKVLDVHVSGKLVKDDYKQLVPEAERLIKEHGKIRVLLEMKDFHGWDASGLWEDIKFDLKHFSDVERVAMVGEKKWQKGMSQFCRPFTTAKVRYFDQTALDEARQWVEAA